nr:hypothetical protein [Klebsormidium sp. TAA2-JRJ3pt]
MSKPSTFDHLYSSLLSPDQQDLLKEVRNIFLLASNVTAFYKFGFTHYFAIRLLDLQVLNDNQNFTERDIQYLNSESTTFSIFYFEYFVPIEKAQHEINHPLISGVTQRFQRYAAFCFARHFLKSYQSCISDILAGFLLALRLRESVPLYLEQLYGYIYKKSVSYEQNGLNCTMLENEEFLSLEMWFDSLSPDEELYVVQRNTFYKKKTTKED